MRLLLSTALTLLTATTAHAQSPEGVAYYQFNQCVKTAAVKYAALSDSAPDAAEAAMASCREHHDAFITAVNNASAVSHPAPLIKGMTEKSRQMAIEIIAEKRLAKN